MNSNSFQGPVSGLAHALDQPSPSLARNPGIALLPRNNSTTTRSEQQKAITILLDQHDYDIFAYLNLARSGSLSSDEVTAVWTLRDCADDEIRTSLEQARKLGESVRYVLSLQELTPNSKRFQGTLLSSGQYPSRTWRRRPLLVRAGPR